MCIIIAYAIFYFVVIKYFVLYKYRNTVAQGQSNKGMAMQINGENGWAMLGLIDDQINEETGEEFAGTCLSDPSLCKNGLTLALWLKISEFY